jgi:Uncharacterized conserved protein (DUF2203)
VGRSLPTSQPGAPSSPGDHYLSHSMRYWTVEEARAYLPRVRELLDVIRGVAVAMASAPGNGHGPLGSGRRVREALGELEEGDIVLRDAESGLIDFHAVGEDGVVYFLCWRDPEPDIGYWHLPEEGFAGRKPLPRAP